MDKTALQFSGGRDSLALLLLMKPHWDRITVYHCSPGDDFQETMKLVDAVSKIVPHFVLVKGDVWGMREKHGFPSDLTIPGVDWPEPEKHFTHYRPMQDRYMCCYRSLMWPLHQQMVKDGVKVILRGQRNSDTHKSIHKHGDVVEGIELLYPIRDWSDAEVENFIRENGWEVPPFYAEGCKDTPNCVHCTAWLEYGGQQYVRNHYPEAYLQVKAVMETQYPAIHQRYILIRKLVDASGF